MPTGNGAFISYAARTTKAGQYQATVRIGSTGNPVVTVSRVVKGKETSLGSYVMKQPYTAGQPLHLRMVVDGAESTNIQTKLWAGDAEPAEWGIEAVDNDKTLNEAGTVGLTTYMSGSAGRRPSPCRSTRSPSSSTDAVERSAHTGRAGKI